MRLVPVVGMLLIVAVGIAVLAVHVASLIVAAINEAYE